MVSVSFSMPIARKARPTKTRRIQVAARRVFAGTVWRVQLQVACGYEQWLVAIGNRCILSRH